MRVPCADIDPKPERQSDAWPPSGAHAPAFLDSPRRFLAVIAGFFAIHIVLRLISSPVADLDESEQLVFSQMFQWGYGPQPPLYTWLQILLFKAFGPSILGLTVLKNTLLFALYAFTYGAARILTRSHLGGILATLGLLFIPQIAWESQRDLTHSVLASASSAATLFIFLKLHETGARRWYGLLGFIIGIGALSNHTYWLFLVGLLGAGFCLREFRSTLANRWMLLSLVIALLVMAPHAKWIAENGSIVLSTSRKLRIRDATPFGLAAMQALGNLAISWVSHVISVVFIFGVLCWKQLRPFPREALRRPPVRLIGLLVSIALVAVAVTMLVTHATSFKGRWLQPLFFCVPIFYAAIVHSRIDRRAFRRVFSTAAAVGAAVMFWLPGRVWLNQQNELTVPWALLFDQLRPEIESSDIVVADTSVIGGNLRLLFPHKNVLTPRFMFSTGRVDRAVIMFNAAFSDAVPPELRLVLAGLGKQLRSGHVRFLHAPLPGQSKSVRLGAAIFE